MKSSVTPLARRTGTNGGASSPTGRPRTSARNAADACLSRAGTIVWLSSMAMTRSCLLTRDLARVGAVDVPVPPDDGEIAAVRPLLQAEPADHALPALMVAVQHVDDDP